MIATYELHRGFTLACRVDAPRTTVFRAWTDPDHLSWFYNDTAPLPADPIQVDLRVGGEWRQHMVIDEFTRYVTGGIYREISPTDRLVFSWGAVGGWPAITMSQLGDVPLVTVTLGDADEADEVPVPHRTDNGTDATANPATDVIFSLALPDHLTAQQAQAWTESGIEENWGLTLDRLVAAVSGGPDRSGVRDG